MAILIFFIERIRQLVQGRTVTSPMVSTAQVNIVALSVSRFAPRGPRRVFVKSMPAPDYSCHRSWPHVRYRHFKS